MAAPVISRSWFVSVSRKVSSYLLNSVFIAQAATHSSTMESQRPTKLEFAVQMTCESCADKVRAALEGRPGVHSVIIDVSKESVLVDSALTSAEVQALIEGTGRRAVLKGIGGSERDLGSAVAMMAGVGNIVGVVRFLQLSEEQCLIDGTIDGLEPGLHGLHVHTLGDLTKDCFSCGEHFNPFGREHGGPGDAERHVGDLGNVVAGPDGRASFRLEDSQLKVWDIIGRSLVVDAGEDDLGRGGHPLSMQTGNSGERKDPLEVRPESSLATLEHTFGVRHKKTASYTQQLQKSKLACGIIARSAGLFQNTKKICACDGVTLWEERDRPVAGKGRSINSAATPAANL